MTRLVRVLLAALVLGSIATAGSSSSVLAAGRPDVVVVMVDDLGALDERVLERLPAIRSLFLERGLRFDSAYSETPLCCPGRASFLTGQHTRRHGVVRNDARLLDPSRTVATVLQGAGYWTALVGKYLNKAELLADRTPAGWDRVAMLVGENQRVGSSTSPWILGGSPATLGYVDRAVVDQSVAALEAAPAGPLFLWANPRAPHKAYRAKDWQPQVEPRYSSDPRCAGIEPWRPPGYSFAAAPAGFPLDAICRSMLTVDDLVAELRVELERQGRDPVWILTSDNGMAWGAHGFPQKNVPWAGRLPFYVAGPGVGSGRTDALVSNIDVGPTIAELAGTSMPFADGESFAGLLAGGPGGRAWMLEDHPLGAPTNGPVEYGPYWGVRTPRWHLLKQGARPAVLYDDVADPWELSPVVNVAVRRELAAHAVGLVAASRR